MRKRLELLRKRIDSLLAEPIYKYVVIITSIISILVIIQAFYDVLVPATSDWVRFLSDADKQLAISFVEWFGVLYGFLLPQILVRVWEQFDEIDNTFDKEADAVKMLLGDLLLLHASNKEFSKNVLDSLKKYVQNVLDFIKMKIAPKDELDTGNSLLTEIRTYYLQVFREDSIKQKENDVLMGELLEQLNNIIDYRGDRISLYNQPIFESLKTIAVITSIVWLVPFYFLHFQNSKDEYLQLGVFGWLLVIAVTFLVIIILSIIEDLDEPLGGYWRVRRDSWVNLIEDIENAYKKLQDADNAPQVTQSQEQRNSAPSIPPAPPQTEPSVDKELQRSMTSQSSTEQPVADNPPPVETPHRQDEGNLSQTSALPQDDLPIEKAPERPVTFQINLKPNIRLDVHGSSRQNLGEFPPFIPPAPSVEKQRVIKTRFFSLRDNSQNHQKKSRNNRKSAK